MSRTTNIKFRGKTVVELGRTVDLSSFPAREKNIDILHDHLNEERSNLIKQLLKEFSAMMAHHPTKEEVEEWLHEVDCAVEYAVETAETIGISRLLVEMMEDENIEIDFY